MQLLLICAVICCCTVPLVALIAFRSMRGRTLLPGGVQDAPSLKSSLPSPVVTRHPRLDFAAGFAPAVQSVDFMQQRNRQGGFVLHPQRLDHAYATQEMGDLSDPHADRSAPFPAYSGGGRITLRLS